MRQMLVDTTIGALTAIMFIGSLLLINTVSAIPSTTAVTDITAGGGTFHATGGNGSCYFKYGIQPDWQTLWTPRQEDITDVFSWAEYGGAIMPSTTYYVVACDDTGCGNLRVPFTTSVLTPLPESTLGAGLNNLTRSRFNLSYLPDQIMKPSTWVFPTEITDVAIYIVTGIALFFVMGGLWLRTRSINVPLIFMLIVSPLFMVGGALGLGVSQEFLLIGQAMFVLSLAGLFITWWKK